MNSSPPRYRVTRVYKTPYPEHLIFNKGEWVEIGPEFKDDPEWKDWIWCKSMDKVEAWVPKQFIEVENQRAKMKRDYDARELSISPEDQLLVYEIINGFGLAENRSGERGWVPMKCLELVNPSVE